MNLVAHDRIKAEICLKHGSDVEDFLLGLGFDVFEGSLNGLARGGHGWFVF